MGMTSTTISQRNAHEYIRQARPFKASSLTGKWLKADRFTWGRLDRSTVDSIRNVIEDQYAHVYVVYSYGTPMLVQGFGDTGQVTYQYINTGYYSNTTSKHQRIIREGLR